MATASGQSALFMALAALVSAGDNIVASSSLYGGTYNQLKVLLPRLGVTIKFVRSESEYELVKGIEDAINDRTRAVYVESIGNPRYDVVDLEAIAEVALRKGVPLIVSGEALPVVALLLYCQLTQVRWIILSVLVDITFVPSLTVPILSSIPLLNGLVVMARQLEASSSMPGTLAGVPMLLAFLLWLSLQLAITV